MADLLYRLGALDDGSQVAGVTNPFTAHAVREDGTTVYATANYKAKSSEVGDASRTALEKAADPVASPRSSASRSRPSSC
ncbi:hypothetical protein [Streptomyces soliscabiei]|uniref:hypothetical protein n=1 Tax=Streptomyces soliscabiei TaxID=588897 RepID=UPI0029A11BA8|nr:hypothetical protein [Streptomyces sp. NY05-11A]MDX2678049.1 hypothetical protein [Streptomyces sp. NY05-11A]